MEESFANGNLDFIQTHKHTLTFDNIKEYVSIAIRNNQENVLVWLYDSNLFNYDINDMNKICELGYINLLELIFSWKDIPFHHNIICFETASFFEQEEILNFFFQNQEELDFRIGYYRVNIVFDNNQYFFI